MYPPVITIRGHLVRFPHHHRRNSAATADYNGLSLRVHLGAGQAVIPSTRIGGLRLLMTTRPLPVAMGDVKQAGWRAPVGPCTSRVVLQKSSRQVKWMVLDMRRPRRSGAAPYHAPWRETIE